MNLTDRAFWLNYWESKPNLVFSIPENFPFFRDLKKIVIQNNTKSMLEIGGFPGYYSVGLKKNMGVNCTLLDYVVHHNILKELERCNGLKEGTIGVIETDLFEHTIAHKFDMVMSNGLIEHFEDTNLILKKHTDFLKTGGVAFISLPNFRGLNGWFQKTFDPENYAKHNIKCMDIALLKSVCKELNLKEIDVRYDGRFMLWLENETEKPLWLKVLKKAIWLPFKILFKLIPIETRTFSPYIVITATK